MVCPGNHSQADGNTARVCDLCIRTKRLCVRLVEVKKEIRMAIYPPLLVSEPVLLGRVTWNIGYRFEIATSLDYEDGTTVVTEPSPSFRIMKKQHNTTHS
jgi:hypothetical protein